MKVSFRIVSDFEFENDLHKQHYELFPKLDSSAPSAKNLAYLKRKATKEKNNGSTLSSFLGYPLPQAAPATPKIRASPQSSADVATKLSSSIDSSLGNGLQTPNTINSPPTVRRASTGEGVKHGSDNTEGPNKCPICGKGFNKPTYLKRHILSHSSVKPYKCDICNWGFFQQCNLKRHMASHSVENGAQGFKCEHCSANFTTKSVLSVHLREAHGDKLVTKKEAQRTATQFDRTSPSSSAQPINNFVNIGPQ